MRTEKQPTLLPAISLRGLVIFPHMILHFDVSRKRSAKAIKAAVEGDRRIFLVTQRDERDDDVSVSKVFVTGVIAQIRQTLNTPDGSIRLLVEGLEAADLDDFVQSDPYLIASVKELPPPSDKMSDTEKDALRRMLTSAFTRYGEVSPKMPKELYKGVLAEKDIERLTELIIFNIYLRTEVKQVLLECGTLKKRAQMLITALNEEISIIRLEQQINEQVRESIDRNQRDFYLREQMRIISNQLGDADEQSEAYNYMDKIDDAVTDPEAHDKLIRECGKLLKLGPGSQEAAVIRSYLDTVLELPWKKYTHEHIDIDRAQKQLEKDHYGLKKVKERILEIVALNRWENADKKGQIICLVGPPGVGKTSVAKSIAKALGRKYVRVSLGGVHDEAEIRGHRKTYLGSMPGRIVKGLTQAGSMNPVMLLDEIDKLGGDYKGDPASAMLEVLDSEQNFAFRDHYLEIPLDLSRVLFITTANTLDTIPAPLLDRMDIIELGSYTREEKFQIAKKHLIPKQNQKHGLKVKDFKITDAALYAIIDKYTKEAGVRTLERTIASLCRKALKKLVSGEVQKVSVKPADLVELLGPPKYLSDDIPPLDEVGLVNGLAWTSVGGVIMPLEVLVLDGTGKIEITGQLGDVMKESAKIAVSLTRSLARKYEIDPDFYKTKDIHIHAPEGAVPKDGPSAGVTMTTALISALSNTAVRRDIAMTGEITLRGKVLPIGGLREKTMAAYKAGVKTVIIPKENEADMSELDDVILDNLNFVLADDIRTVLDTALVQTNSISDTIKPLPEMSVSDAVTVRKGSGHIPSSRKG